MSSPLGSERVAIDLRWLQRQRELELEVIYDSGRDFTVVHPCELDDPSEFLGEGSVILLTGIAFRERPEDLADYVRTVAAAGVRGIGFGIGIAHQQPPEGMISAAREANLSLFVIPRAIPFVSILSAVHREFARQRNRSRELLLEMQERLNRAAVEGGLERLMEVGSLCLGTHLLLSDNDGRWAAMAWNETTPQIDLGELEETIRTRGFGSAARVGELRIIVHRMGRHGERVHALIAVSASNFDANSRALLKHCAGLAELIINRPMAYRQTHRELNSLALAIQLGVPRTSEAMADVFHSVRDASGQVRPVLLLAEQPRTLERAVRALDDTLDRLGRITFSLRIDAHRALILFRGDRSLPEVTRLLEGSRRGVRIAIGTPRPWHDLDQEVVADLERAAFSLAPGDCADPQTNALSWIDDAAVRKSLTRRARETWGKLAASDPELTRTLKVYLRNSGNLSRTADELQVHRHTMKKRMDTISELIEADVTNPVAAAELLILAVAQVD